MSRAYIRNYTYYQFPDQGDNLAKRARGEGGYTLRHHPAASSKEVRPSCPPPGI